MQGLIKGSRTNRSMLLNMGYSQMGGYMGWTYWYNEDHVLKLHEGIVMDFLPHEIVEGTNGRIIKPKRKTI